LFGAYAGDDEHRVAGAAADGALDRGVGGVEVGEAHAAPTLEAGAGG